MTTITLNHSNNFKTYVQAFQQISILFILCIGFMTPTSAQPFVKQTGTNNPLNSASIGFLPNPTFVDINNDGDFDAFIGENNGTIHYYENTGTNVAPTFTLQSGTNSPLNTVDVGALSKPFFVDIDNDNDFDLFIGANDGTIRHYENIGSVSNPSFIMLFGSANPFNGVDLGLHVSPTFVDINNDGDFDAFIGDTQGKIFYFENTGTSTNATFVEKTGSDNPFNSVDVGEHSTPTFVDFDQDGDFDAVIGEFLGFMNYYENTGTNTTPTFVAKTGSNNPFNGIDVGNRSSPIFVDINNDGDIDLFSGEQNGSINYYLNTASLPVELTYFRGQATTEGNLLTWQTASEENNKGFEVQRSTTGGEWETIDFVVGNGTTLEVQNYDFTDYKPFNENNYYRLKQIDFDGAYEYSEIINITIGSSNRQTVQLFPNPVKEQFTIQGISGRLSIYNFLGQPVYTTILTESNGQISMNNFAAGQYLVVVISEDGRKVTKRIMKQ